MDGVTAVAVALRRHREEFLAAEGSCLELVALPTKGEKSAGSVFKCHTILIPLVISSIKSGGVAVPKG